MKQILASDYDGTLLVNQMVSEEDRHAIIRFRAQGNVFGIVTGRGIGMLFDELVQRGIEFDFLIGNSGAIACDRHRNILFRQDIDWEVAQRFIELIQPLRTFSLTVGDGDGFAQIQDEPGNHLLVLNTFIKPRWRPLADIFKDRLINSFHGLDCDHERSIAIAKKIETEFTGTLKVHRNGIYLDIVAAGITKQTGLQALLEQFPDSVMQTIGDNYNDIDMLEGFDSFCMRGAPLPVQQAAGQIVDSVAEGIAILLRD